MLRTRDTLSENVSGKLMTGGDYTQSANGILELNIGSKDDLLEIKGDAILKGKLRLNFTDNYIPAYGVTLITYDKRQRNEVFSSIETTGLPGSTK